MNAQQQRIVASVTFALFLLGSSSALAQSLGSAQSFAILGGSAVNANGTGSVINGNVGVSPGTSITGFPPGTGATVLPPFSFLHSADAAANSARAATLTLYNSLLVGSCTPLGSDQLNGQNLGPGCYSGGALDLASTGTLTLTGPGIYIFRAASSLTANTSSNVVLDGVDPCTVFWQVTSLATLNGDTFPGTVVAQAGVHLGSSVHLAGRALAAAAGDVTLAGLDTVGGCSGTAAAPTISKAFSPVTINAGGGAGGVSTLTITLSNPDTSIATLTAPLVDTLPAGVVVAATPGAATTCTGGTFATAPASGDTSVTLSAGAIPAGSSCTVTVNVSAPAAGSYVNTLATGALGTSNGNNAAPAQASLTVNPATLTSGPVPPTVAKSFDPTTINAGDPSTLTIILSNASSDTNVTTAAFTDTLPPGVVIAGSATNGCTPSDPLIAILGSSTISLSNGFVPFGSGTTPGTCTVTVPVTAAAGGSFVNTLDSAVATLTVNAVAPTLSKRLGPATIFAGGVSTLTITLSNPNTIAATNTGLLDTLPSGVMIAAAPNTINTCSGILTATPGTGIIQLIGGTIPAGSGTTAGTCTVAVNVTAAGSGSFLNTLPANALQTSNGNNTVPASAALTVKPLPVPTLSRWGMNMLAALLALVAFAAMRRHAM